jgi:hypothetical protein
MVQPYHDDWSVLFVVGGIAVGFRRVRAAYHSSHIDKVGNAYPTLLDLW